MNNTNFEVLIKNLAEEEENHRDNAHRVMGASAVLQRYQHLLEEINNELAPYKYKIGVDRVYEWETVEIAPGPVKVVATK